MVPLQQLLRCLPFWQEAYRHGAGALVESQLREAYARGVLLDDPMMHDQTRFHQVNADLLSKYPELYLSQVRVWRVFRV